MIAATRARLAPRFAASVLDPWLAALPARLDDLTARWGLRDVEPLDAGGTRGLVAIDPRPCVGDPAFDAVDWPAAGGARVAAWREVFAPLLTR